MYSFQDYDDTDAVGTYNKSIRDRALGSVNDLQTAWSAPEGNPSPSSKQHLTESVQPRVLRYRDGSLHRASMQHADTARQLQEMLANTRIGQPHVSDTLPQMTSPQRPRYYEPQQQMTSPPQFRREPPHQVAPPLYPQAPEPQLQLPSPAYLPSPEATATLIQNQTGYIQQLETENIYVKDELSLMKSKTREMVEENSRLHAELKKAVVHEILMEGGMVAEVDDALNAKSMQKVLIKPDYKRWQLELERLTSLHAAKADRLETQLSQAKTDLQRYERIVEDLTSRLRMQDAIPTRDNDMTAPSILLAEPQRNIFQQTIDRVTRERDDLIHQISGLKGKLVEASHREEDAYQQMKNSVEFVEQAQLEQTQLHIEKEQLAEELANMRQRFEGHVTQSHNNMGLERDLVRKENQSLVHELNVKLKEVTETHVSTEHQMAKLTREKVALISQLEETRSQLKTYQKEVNWASESYKVETTNASIQRNHAVQETHRMRNEVDQLKRAKDQEKSCLSAELEALRSRLNNAERELVNSKEECIHLTTNSQELERELHLAKLARDAIERGRSDDLNTISKRTRHREDELNTLILEADEKHTRTTNEFDQMLNKQNKLIGKLRDECRRQALNLEKLTKKYRSQVGKLGQQNGEYKQRLERAVTRLSDLEEQNEQHAQLHEKMQDRLHMLDDNAGHKGQQILELLSKQSSLMRDRQLLAREVEYLREQILPGKENDGHNLYSSRKDLIDDIFNKINYLEKD